MISNHFYYCFILFIYILIYLFLFVFDICYCKIFDLFLIFSFSKGTTMKIRLFQLFCCHPSHIFFIYILLLILYFNCIFLIVSKFVNNFMANYTYLPTYLRILGKSLLLKTTALLVFFLWSVKSLKNL